MKTHAYVSLSGGLDSTATLAQAVRKHGAQNVTGVSLNYGQRHLRELRSAEAVAGYLGVRRVELDLQGLLHGSSLLGEGAVPEGHYAKETMSATVVNGRNLAFISALVGMTQPGDEVWVGVHGGDHFIYPDCRPAFIEPLATALRNTYNVDLIAPWLYLDKTAIAASFADDLPLAALTWSCYKGSGDHCGRCGTCVERAEAFDLAGIDDPTTYTDPDYWRQAVAEHEASQA
jgi:7-cyano-7-deazaguanine synthase